MRALTIPANWPLRNASRHIASRPHLWHVQDLGAGPVLLLLHGAGGATHSFRNLIPLLAQTHRVIAIDLPGQGFTVPGSRLRCGLEAMAHDVRSLCIQENWHPTALIGHSAGAALSLRVAQIMPVSSVIGINAALSNFDGVAGWVFPIMAKVLAMTPLVATVFSKYARTPGQVRQLIAATGSRIDHEGEAQYLHLLRMSSHVDATLSMMAQWNPGAFMDSLPTQTTPCLLITAAGDRAVPSTVSKKAATAMPQARWVELPLYGHLVHEEAADKVAALILGFLNSLENPAS